MAKPMGIPNAMQHRTPFRINTRMLLLPMHSKAKMQRHRAAKITFYIAQDFLGEDQPGAMTI